MIKKFIPIKNTDYDLKTINDILYNYGKKINELIDYVDKVNICGSRETKIMNVCHKINNEILFFNSTKNVSLRKQRVLEFLEEIKKDLKDSYVAI